MFATRILGVAHQPFKRFTKYSRAAQANVMRYHPVVFILNEQQLEIANCEKSIQ